MRVWSAHINSLLAFNMWISIYVWHITECFAVRFAKFEGVAITRFTIVNCSVTSIIPFYASRFHNNRGLKRFCFWQISRCHCYIADHLFYFDIWFRPDFFHTVYILIGDVWWSCSWTMVDSSKTGTNLRGTVVGSSLSASGECDTEAQDPPVRFFRCSLSPFIYQYQIIKLLPIPRSSGSYRFYAKPRNRTVDKNRCD